MAILKSKAVKVGLLCLLAIVVVAGVLAVWVIPGKAHKAVNTTWFGVAIKGYDTVAYHTEGRALKGKKEFEFAWHDAIWRFASPSNRDRFAKNPERFAPQYGGY
jgi:hypothetical protein